MASTRSFRLLVAQAAAFASFGVAAPAFADHGWRPLTARGSVSFGLHIGVAPPPPPVYMAAPPPAYMAYPAPTVYAPPVAPAPRPGWHTHDGFFMRLQLGGGGLAWGHDDPTNDYLVSGGAGTFRLALGGAVNRHAVLYGEVFTDTAQNPMVRKDGQTFRATGSSTSAVGIGPGLALYSDSNWFLSGSFQLFHLDVDLQGGDGATETIWSSAIGTGWTVSAGKEWWVSENWALGFAGSLFFGSAPDVKDPRQRWQAASAMLSFSATYN